MAPWGLLPGSGDAMIEHRRIDHERLLQLGKTLLLLIAHTRTLICVLAST